MTITGRRAAPELDTARRLLSYEGATSARGDSYAAAAGRVYDKINAQLGPLLGPAGVRALFVRSAQLGRHETAGLAKLEILESSTTLAAFLRTLPPGAIVTAAEALFGTFLSLMTTFIGDRLTAQALRRAWPQATAPAEKKT